MRSPPALRRSAFTLVELLVACFVLGIGVLALASTAAAVARLTGDAARAGLAAERGQARMEGMRSARCVPLSGTQLAGGITEWWTTGAAPGGQALSDSVRYVEGVRHDLRTDALSSEVWCP